MLCFAALACVGYAAAQDDAREADSGIVNRVHQAFLSGDVSALLKNCGEHVEIGLFGSPSLYSRPQATYVLQGFFREFPPSRFLVESSNRAAEDLFVFGRYWSRQGEQPLGVFLRIRHRDGTPEVREVRVERSQL